MLLRQTKKDAAPAEAKQRPGKSARPPMLRVSRDGTVLQKLPLTRPQLLIGRSEDSDLSIPSRYVSRYHILLVRHNGHTILIDLDSTNGTFVNSEHVYNHVLADGDRITIDRQSLYVQYSIEYCELDKTTRESSDIIQSAAGAIKRALASIRHQLGNSDTDFLPTLREDVPTEIGIVDDR